MKKKLIIVESPTKVKTIKKFLGSGYEVLACKGHIRDLPKSSLGIDVENDYEPKYITIRGKGDIIAELKRAAKRATKIYLATDPDREGEAISWHLKHALKLEDGRYSRITFNEITENAVKNAIENPSEIDMNLVDAQQARRELDRLVGYSISPVLWAKVKRGLSAGRVQSAALKLICDREAEIDAFIPKEYWSLDVELKSNKIKRKTLKAHYHGTGKEATVIENEEELVKLLKDLEKNKFIVDSIKETERKMKPQEPFTTSTMQQEASKILNFSAKKTMQIAQSLYEGVNIEGYGLVGLITYLRTDSKRISDDAKRDAMAFIEGNFGTEFKGEYTEKKKSENKVWDAHEAIRPTNVNLTPVMVKDSLSRDENRLYQMIWKRFVASQMAQAIYNIVSVNIKVGKHIFKASTSKVVFDGYLRLLGDEGSNKKSKENIILGELDKNEELELVDYIKNQHFTQPQAHFSEASLIKELEDKGIGRPSTYAPTITTLLARHYIVKEQKLLYVSELGSVINLIMNQSFPKIVNTAFTANMESELDKVEAGKMDWKDILRGFYPDFSKSVDKAQEELEKVHIEDEVTDIKCDKCGRNMVIKYGPHGKFLACPGFPDCRNAKTYFEPTGVKCPKCGGEIVKKKTKKGRPFYGCTNYPECDFTTWQLPAKIKCPKCGGLMVHKGKLLACINEECAYVAPAEELEKALSDNKK